jgi:acyl-CoA synthetase (AMP-forming)/AMP-acid ligase II
MENSHLSPRNCESDSLESAYAKVRAGGEEISAAQVYQLTNMCLIQAYGCTELSSCVSQSGTRDRDAPLVATGTLLANITVRFVNEEGRDVPSNIPGEICVSSPTIMM